MSYQYVNVEIIRKVAVIEFNYSPQAQRLSKVFYRRSDAGAERPQPAGNSLRHFYARPGEQRFSFPAGHDIHELPGGRRDPLSYDDPLRQITRMIQKYPKPVISMVEGSVLGRRV